MVLKAAVTLKTSDSNNFYCDAFNSYLRCTVFSESETFRVFNKNENKCEVNILDNSVGPKQSYGQPYAWTCLFACGTGRAMLNATIASDLNSPSHLMNVPFFITAAFSITAYPALAVYQAGNGNKFGGYGIDMPEINNKVKHLYSTALDELILAPPGSSMDFHLCGGP